MWYNKYGDKEMESAYRLFNISPKLEEISRKSEDEVKDIFKQIEDICVEYEELFEGPTINIWIKRGFFDIYDFINMSIETIKKHGKNISLLYRDETEEGWKHVIF